jgi:hypothetical protein
MRFLLSMLLVISLVASVSFARVSTAVAQGTVLVIADPGPATAAPVDEPVRTRPMWALVGVGAGIFAASYGANLAGSFGYVAGLEGATLFGAWVGLGRGSYDTAPYLGWSLVPLIGSFVQVPISNEFIVDDWVRGLHVVTGVIQWIGLGLAIAGTVARERAPARAPRAPRYGEPLLVSPWAAATGAGMTVGGSF